jgi:hypothetical protein
MSQRVNGACLTGGPDGERFRAGKSLEEIDDLGFPRQLAKLSLELFPS